MTTSCGRLSPVPTDLLLDVTGCFVCDAVVEIAAMAVPCFTVDEDGVAVRVFDDATVGDVAAEDREEDGVVVVDAAAALAASAVSCAFAI